MAIPQDLKSIKYGNIKLAVKKSRPQSTVIYGSGGVGKSVIACYSPNPVIIPMGRETGQERFIDYGVPCYENNEELPYIDFVYGCIASLLYTEHSRKTVIFDNLGTYREIVDEDVEKDNKGVDLSAFGKKQALGYPYYPKLLAGFDALMKKKEMNVILLAHSIPVNINLPDGTYYQRIGIHAPRGDNTNVAGLLEARFHNVLYLRSESRTRKVKGVMGQEKTIATESEVKRVIYTKESGTYYAKSRFDLEEVYEIESMPDATELIKKRSNESIIKLWNDIYKEH